uniref:AN1-type domain-containing protein n=1 Tax=Plectus sambesii TaxID=2011161 RepID=A0A914VTN6_9BILA
MAEFPDLGKHCNFRDCNRLDFLPMKCDACTKVYCSNHITYISHECSSSYKKDVQVPVCPLCNQPVPVARGETPDFRVGQHIDNDCKSDPAVAKRKIYSNRCSLNGCKKKELVPITCGECRQNYCLKHRHTTDHDCKGFQGSGRAISNAGLASMKRQEQAAATGRSSAGNARSAAASSASKNVQDKMTEDEALAMALHMSLNEGASSSSPTPPMTQEEADRRLAEHLQQTEYNQYNNFLFVTEIWLRAELWNGLGVGGW